MNITRQKVGGSIIDKKEFFGKKNERQKNEKTTKINTTDKNHDKWNK